MSLNNYSYSIHLGHL